MKLLCNLGWIIFNDQAWLMAGPASVKYANLRKGAELLDTTKTDKCIWQSNGVIIK